VFASVGSSDVNVYDPESGDLEATLDDGSDEPFTVGSAFDSHGNFYVTDDTNGEISEFDSSGTLLPTFASGLSNPLSLDFDSSGNLYVGQQATPYIAEFSSSGARLSDIGPVDTQRTGDDWIALSSDQCTFYYTTEGNEIFRYNKCSSTQEPDFNSDPLAGSNAFELRILPDGDVLVADSDRIVLLDSSGSVIRTYMCSDIPDCGGQIFGVALDPDGTDFWAADDFSGNIWEIDIATGSVLQEINASTAYLYALSVKGEPDVGATGPAGPEGGYVTALEDSYGGNPTECTCIGGDGKKGVGEPINPMDGDFYTNTTDLSLPGPGLPLSFARGYDASAAQAGVTSPLGPGWADNLNMSVAVDSDTGIATVTESNGAQSQFAPSSGGQPWCSASQNFCPVTPRDIATLEHNSDGTWTFTDSVGSPLTYTFSSSGTLSEIANAAGQHISAASESSGSGSGSSACPSSATNCTVWTSDASTPHPTLTEVFTSGELTQVVGYAASGGSAPSVTFCYYGESSCSPPSSGGLAGELYSVSDPGGLTTTYAYDASNSSSEFQNDLVSETDPGGGVLTNVYNATGSSPTGQITQQTDPSGEVLTLTYDESAGSPPGDGTDDSTTVTQSPGAGLADQVTTYTYAYGELVSTTLDPGSPSASTTSLTRSMITGQVTSNSDPDSNASSISLPDPSSPSEYLNAIDPTSMTDGLGNTTLYAYTPSNQVWCEVDPAEVANGVTCPSTEPTSAPSPGSKSTLDLGATLTYYDAAGNPTYVTDPLGNTSETRYTASEQPWCQVDADQFTLGGVSCPSDAPSSPPTGSTTGYTTTLYDSAGNVTSVTTPTGATTTDAYTDPSFPTTPTQVSDPQGDVTTTTLDSAGRPVSQTESFRSYSATTITAYDSAGRIFCTIAPLAYAQGHTACPTTAPSAAPSPGSDPWPGAQITIFDGDGHPLDQINPLGGVTVTAYNGAGQVYCSLDPYDYANGVMCPSAPPTSAPTGTATGYTTTTYDAEGRTTSVTDPIGDTTASSYDLAGNVVSTTTTPANTTNDPASSTTYSYDADNNQTSTSTEGSETLTSYDPDGNVYCSVSANAYAEGTSAYQCPPWQAGWISTPPNPESEYSTTPSSTQADNVTLSFTDADGNEVQSTNPDLDTTVDVFDPAGRTYCTMDGSNTNAYLGAHSDATYPYACPSTPPTSAPSTGSDPGYALTIYNASGNETSSSDADANTTTYGYDAFGDQTSVTDPDGNETTNCYYWQIDSCAAGEPDWGGGASMVRSTTRPDTTADPDGEVTMYTYRAGGSAYQTTTPAGRTTEHYDANDDVTNTDYLDTASGYATPANVSFTFFQDGSRQTMTDATGTTTYAYDDAGDTTSQALVAGVDTDLANETMTYGYDAAGQVGSITYPSYGSVSDPTATYAYDNRGDMTSVSDWSGNAVGFAYDADGNETAQYNETSSDVPEGTSNTTFTFDAADQNLSSVVNFLGLESGGSSPAARHAGPAGGSTAGTSDPGMRTLGQRFKLKNPSSGTADPFSSTGGSSGSDSGTSLDHADSSATPEDSCTPTSYSLGVFTGAGGGARNGDGQITSSVIAADDSCGSLLDAPNYYSYDPASRVVYEGSSAQSSSPDNETYDPAGNLQSADEALIGSSYSYSSDAADEVTSQSGSTSSTFSYDTLGDQVGDSGNDETYGYDQLGDLTSANSTTYSVNGDGLEAASQSGSGPTEQFVWSDVLSSLPLVMSDSTNYYLYGPSTTPVEEMNVTDSPPSDNPMFLNFAPDSGISLLATTNTDGDMVNGTFYDLFGADADSPVSAFGFDGQYTDSTTNLVNMRARWYEPGTGSFATVDPATATTNQPYEFAGDDPVNESDPTGMAGTGGSNYHFPKASQPECQHGSTFGPCTITDPGTPCPDVASDGFTCLNAQWNTSHPFAGAPNSYNYLCGSFLLQVCFAVTGSGSVAVSVGAGLRGVSAGEGVVLGKQPLCGPSNVNSYLSNWSAGVFGGDIFGVGASRNIGGAGLTSAQAGFTTPGISPWISFGWVF